MQTPNEARKEPSSTMPTVLKHPGRGVPGPCGSHSPASTPSTQTGSPVPGCGDKAGNSSAAKGRSGRCCGRTRALSCRLCHPWSTEQSWGAHPWGADPWVQTPGAPHPRSQRALGPAGSLARGVPRGPDSRHPLTHSIPAPAPAPAPRGATGRGPQPQRGAGGRLLPRGTASPRCPAPHRARDSPPAAAGAGIWGRWGEPRSLRPKSRPHCRATAAPSRAHLRGDPILVPPRCHPAARPRRVAQHALPSTHGSPRHGAG